MTQERAMLDHLFNKLKDREREVGDSMVEGSCKDFAEYIK